MYIWGYFDYISPVPRDPSDHFFNPALLQSQFDTLEEPGDALVLDIRQTPEALVQDILEKCPPDAVSCTGQAAR